MEEPASAVPVSNTPEVDSLKLITLSLAMGRTSEGVDGATVSTVKLIGDDAATFPATSVAITLIACGPCPKLSIWVFDNGSDHC